MLTPHPTRFSMSRVFDTTIEVEAGNRSIESPILPFSHLHLLWSFFGPLSSSAFVFYFISKQLSDDAVDLFLQDLSSMHPPRKRQLNQVDASGTGSSPGGYSPTSSQQQHQQQIHLQHLNLPRSNSWHNVQMDHGSMSSDVNFPSRAT